MQQQSGVTAAECLDAGYVCIRVRNESEFHFRSLTVKFPNRTVEYGSIGPGATSAYRRTDRAYRYAYTEAWSGLRKFVLLPNDYVGERDLRPGIYTYEYSAILHGWILGGSMNVELQVDGNGP